eukprot:2830157-Rhodomonas_salina.1
MLPTVSKAAMSPEVRLRGFAVWGLGQVKVWDMQPDSATCHECIRTLDGQVRRTCLSVCARTREHTRKARKTERKYEREREREREKARAR